MKLFKRRVQTAVLPDRILRELGLSPSEFGSWRLDDEQEAKFRAELGIGTYVEDDDLVLENPEIPPRRAHQQEAMDFGRALDPPWRFGLFYDMGLGKSRIAVDILEETETSRHAVILAPRAVLWQWADQFKEWSGRHATVVYATSREKRISLFNKPGPWILNYDALDSWECKRCGARQERSCCVGEVYKNKLRRYPVVEALLRCHPKALICDESTRVKSPGAHVSRHVHKIARKIDGPCIIMSGTPVAKNPHDLWSQFKVLQDVPLGFHHWAEMRRRYCKLAGPKQNWVKGTKNLDELARRIQPHSIRKMIEECVDLPEKIVSTVPVELEAKERRAYNEMAKRLVAEISKDRVVRATNVLSKMVYLQHITGGSTMAGHRGAKMKALLDLVEDAPTPGIIWCRFTDEIRAVAAKLGKSYRVRTYYGETSDREREEAIAALNNGKVDFLVGQAQAGGIGLNLQASCWMCFYSHSYSWLEYQQASRRIYRVGQDKVTRILNLVARDTCDTNVLAVLEANEDMSARVLDNWREWMRAA